MMIGLGAIAGFLPGALSFFGSTTGKFVLIGVALVAWTLYQRDQAADKAQETCQAEQLQATIDELRRQRNVAQEALLKAAEAAARSKEELVELREEYDAIRATLSEEEGAAPCVIPGTVLERLQSIK